MLAGTLHYRRLGAVSFRVWPIMQGGTGGISVGGRHVGGNAALQASGGGVLSGTLHNRRLQITKF